MQAQPVPQRHSQRLQAPADVGEAASVRPASNMNASATAAAPRTSSGSGRSQPSRSLNQPDKQISQIEKSVTHLLVATKQLLETLTQWSRDQAQEEEVSDVYVRLGYEFNLACRAFNSIGVDTSNLGPVPDQLRVILEHTLGREDLTKAEALDVGLPRIRNIIVNLLHGLKDKQGQLRGRTKKDGSSSKSKTAVRQPSGTSLGSNETGLTQMLEDVPTSAATKPADSRYDGGDMLENQNTVPARNASAPLPSNRDSGIKRHSFRREATRSMTQSNSSSSISSTTLQNIPTLPPYSDPDQTPAQPISEYIHPPPPPPKQQDALTALQRGGDLERRASRRFSQYQIHKHLGASPNGISVIPPAQNSPIPNRARGIQESRESMNAVRARDSYRHARQKSNSQQTNISPSRSGTARAPQRISEEREEPPAASEENLHLVPPNEPATIDSPTVKTPDDMYRPLEKEFSLVGPTLHGPPPSLPVVPEIPAPQKPKAFPTDNQTSDLSSEARSEKSERRHGTQITPPQSQLINLEDSPSSGKDLTLFLQYKSKVKKFVLSEGYDELTIARLQLAFIEKFAWNTHNNGVDLPEIYIQDPVSGVRHELEDLSDVKDRSVLVLNVEVLDEVKRHFDDGIGDIRKMLEGMRGVVDGQNTLMQRFGDRQLEASKEMARMSFQRSRSVTRAATLAPGTGNASPSAVSLSEVQSLRRDIAVLRKTYASLSSDFAASLESIKAKGAAVKAVATDTLIPTFESSAGRAHVNKGKKALSADSEALVNHVDDLSDTIEDLRKDVVTRGVRPLPRQLETISKDISSTVKELAKMKEFLRREKPIWTKIWEAELNLVCTERDELTQQEDLMADLHGDLEDLTGVFKLVEEATRQQNLQSQEQNGVRRNVSVDVGGADIDPHKAKDSVLGEVRALRPNHEDRLEAIERAEKARLRELESRKGGEFQHEVEKFVEQGKLRKTGGMEEVERVRRVREERARKENYERAAARAAGIAYVEQPPEETTTAAETADGIHKDEQHSPESVFEDAHSQAHTPQPESVPLPPSQKNSMHDLSSRPAGGEAQMSFLVD